DRGRAEGSDRRRRVGGGGGAAGRVLGAAVAPLRCRLVSAAVGARRGDRAVAAAAAGIVETLVALDAVLRVGAFADDLAALLDAALVGVRGTRGGRRRRGGLRVREGLPFLAGRLRGGCLVRVGRRFAVGVEFVDQPVAVVVEAVGAGGRLQRKRGDSRRGPGVDGGALREGVGAGEGGAQRGDQQEAGDSEDQCGLSSHPKATAHARIPLPGQSQQATHWYECPQRARSLPTRA